MADPILSVVAQRIEAIIEEQIRKEVNLVRGVDKKVLDLSKELNNIRNVLDDAERKGIKDKSVRDWLARLEHASYDMDDVLDEWTIALLTLQMEQQTAENNKVCSFLSCSCLPFKKIVVRRDIAVKIENVSEKLDKILTEKDRYGLVTSPSAYPSRESWRVQSTSFVDLPKVHGRDIDRDVVTSKVMMIAEEETEQLEILSIVGVGGVGKTTLAQLVYNDSRVKECFELRIWICVSDPFDVAGIAKGIVENVTGSSPTSNQLEVVLRCLKECISGKKFLLVMDDVWTEDYTKWEPLQTSLKCGGNGSKVLVTTRNERVSKMMGSFEKRIHRLGQLSDETCWLLLQRIALFGRDKGEWEKYQGIGTKIANKCKGLPLAAKALGSLLRFKNSLQEWENVLCSDIWQLEEAEVDLFPHLLLSYNELSPALKRCFSYCAIFPKDSQIIVKNLIGHWMALGYLGSDNGGGDMELRGRKYFDNLAMRSLLQDFEKDYLDGQIKTCKMHDIVHDFARFLRKDGGVEAGIKETSACIACSPLLVSSVEEYRSAFCNSRDSRICSCLSRVRVLSLSLGDCIPQEMEKFIHLRWLDLTGKNLSAKGDLETICKLYNLQTLLLRRCHIEEIPKEIGNLIHLRHLDLSFNDLLRELPESICDLLELQILDISFSTNISRVPQGIHTLINLKHLNNYLLEEWQVHFNQGLAQLTSLRTLQIFCVGRNMNKLGWLKNLNHLSGSLRLFITLSSLENIVDDVREGELSKKEHIQQLEIIFKSEECGVVDDWQRIDVLEALEPHPNLQKLTIYGYMGSKLPAWIVSPLNQLKSIYLCDLKHVTSLLPMGKLPCLEAIDIYEMDELQFVGREFLEITTTTTEKTRRANTIVLPKLKNLTFGKCPKWNEWEDIPAEEEDSIAVSLMPRLTNLTIWKCFNLEALPHRLLHKVPLEKLNIYGSTKLIECYGDKQGSAWKSISDLNPTLRLIT